MFEYEKIKKNKFSYEFMINFRNALLNLNNLNFLSEIAISSRAIYLANYSLHTQVHNHVNISWLGSTSFPRFSPTRPYGATGRREPGNEVGPGFGLAELSKQSGI